MGLTLSIALTHIRWRLRQTLVGILGVATGVGFAVMMASLMQGSQKDFIAQLVDSLAHITISDDRRAPSRQPAQIAFDDAYVHNLITADRRRGIKNPLAVVRDIRESTGAAISASVRANVLVRQAGRDTAVVLVGIDPEAEAKVSNVASKMVEGDLTSLARASNGIVVGGRFAEKLGLRPGNTVPLTVSGGRTMLATVTGIFRTGIAQIDEFTVYSLLRTAQVLAGQPALINEVRIKLDNALDAREVAARIEADTGYKSVSWQEAHEDLLSAFEIRNFIMYTVVGAILLVASFGTYNIISTITHEKTRDIAIMKSLGLKRTMLRRIFVLEALLIGLLGVLLGFVLGVALTAALGTVQFKDPFGDPRNLPVIYELSHYLIAGGIALASSFIAAWLPASKASSVNPVEIIRGAS